MRTKLSRIAQKFLGDLDEIESCCIGSDDEEYRKKPQSNVTSPPPPIQPMGFQYFDPITINPKKGDSGLYVSGISIKDQKPPLSGQPNKYHQNFKQQFSSSSNTNFNDAIAADSQIKAGKDYVNEDFTNRIIKFDDTDYSRMNSPNQMVSPHASNLVSFYEQRSEIGGAGGTSGIGGGQKKSTLYSQQGTANFSKQSINAAYNTSRLTNIQGYQLKYPNSNMRQFGKSSTVEYIRQTSASIGNAIENAHHYQHSKTLSNQAINIPNPDDAVALITDDIEIEISANAQRVGNKFIHSELNIKEMNPPSKNLIDLNQNSNFQKQTTFNAINNDYTIPIDPTNQPYVDMYNTNSKNLQSTEKVRISSLASQVPSVSLSNNSNRRIINVANLKNQKDFESQPSDAQHQTPTALLNKLEAEQIISSVSHDLNKLQFGGKLLQDKQTVSQQAGYGYGYGYGGQMRDNSQTQGIKASNKYNLEATGVVNQYIEEQEQQFSSNENLLQEPLPHPKIAQQHEKKKKLFSDKESDLIFEEDQHYKRNRNNGKLSQMLSQSSSNERISQYMHIQQMERNQTNSPTYKGSNYYTNNYQESQYNDLQNGQMNREDIVGEFQGQAFMKPPQHNIYSATKNGMNPLMMKSQAIPYNSNRNTFMQEQFKVQSTILSPSKLNGRTQTHGNPNNLLEQEESHQINFIQYIMEMNADELKKRVLQIISYVKEIQNYVLTIRRSIETNLNARLSEKQGSNIYNQSRKRSQETKNQSFNKMQQQQDKSPLNNKQTPLANQSAQGRFPQINQSHQLNQSGILNNRTPPLQANPNTNNIEEETIRISTISNIQKKLPKQKEQRKPKLMVFFGHQNWNLVVNMMMGIQMSVQSAASNVILNENNTMPDLQSRDFKVKYLFELLPRKDNFEKEWSYKVCKFQDYAPNVFQRIRMFYNITDEQYLKSLGPNQLFNLGNGGLNSFSQLTSTGKSGSFFYYTADGQFTLKTVSRAEFHHLKFILRNYYEHVKDNRNSLIIKFFGLHKIKIRMKKSTKVEIVYIVIMGNVFHTTKLINERYDLKGSTYGRSTKIKTQGVTMKDLDFLENKTKIQAKYDEYEEFMSVVRKDAKFFEENNIIDYSMLVGIHYNFNQNQEQSDQVSYTIREQLSRVQQYRDFRQTRDISSFSSRDQKLYYLFGIIDILTCFNAKKKFEYVAKRIAFGPTISAIPPSQYSSRFVKFMDEMFDDDSKVPPELKQ